MLIHFTSTALLVLLILQTLTGLSVLFWPVSAFLMDLHRWGSWAVIVLLPLKGVIVYRSLARGLRRSISRGLVPILSSLMAGMLLLLLTAGLVWTWRIGEWLVLFGQTVISWHWILGLVILPLLLVHVWQRWPNPSRRFLATRRAALSGLAAAIFGVVGWRLAEWLAAARQAINHPRSPATGSREYRSFSGNSMPVTTNYGEDPHRLQADEWRLMIGGMVEQPLELNYAQLMSLPADEMVATLDCTVGWWSSQRWTGVPLMALVNRARPLAQANFVRLWSDTGYNKTFSFAQAQPLLLATHIQGEVLSHEHGFPLRLVAAGWRGWFWVKWLVEVELVARPVA